MIRVKVAAESTCIFVGAPNRILDIAHSKMNANIDSINDKVYVEFFDVLKEDVADPLSTPASDMSNLKLLSQKIFDVRDFPFKSDGKALGFKVLMPVEHSGNVANFTFNAVFQRSVPSEDVEKPLVVNNLYLLFFRMIQSAKEMLHHHKDLDTSVLFAELKNLTRSSTAQRRLSFNKEILEIGYLHVQLYDQL